MNTREFIEMLQKADPNGEAEVVVCGEDLHNEPVWFVERKEGYWDGSYGKLITNDSKGFNLAAYERTKAGNKLCIRYVSAEDLVYMDSSFEIIDNVNYFGKSLDCARKESKKIEDNYKASLKSKADEQ